MDDGNVNPTQHLSWWLRDTTYRTRISLLCTEIWTRNSPIRIQWVKFRSALCSVHSEIYHRPHFIVGWSWNKSLHLLPQQRCYCENSASPVSACVMRRHYSYHVHARFTQYMVYQLRDVLETYIYIQGGEGWLGFPDIWSGQKPWWNWYLTPEVNFGEVRRVQLAKSTLLTSSLVSLGSFQIF